MEQEQPKIIDANSIITQDNKLYHEFVECISSALDARDPYTGDHSRRVSDTATVLAKMLGLADDDSMVKCVPGLRSAPFVVY